MNFQLTQEQRMIYEYGDRISKQFDHNYWRCLLYTSPSPRD